MSVPVLPATCSASCPESYRAGLLKSYRQCHVELGLQLEIKKLEGAHTETDQEMSETMLIETMRLVAIIVSSLECGVAGEFPLLVFFHFFLEDFAKQRRETKDTFSIVSK